MTNRSNLWIKEAFKQLRKEFGGECSKILCSSKTNLQFAHMKETGLSGRGRGRKERYYDIVNNKTSYILLCVVCHIQEDSKNG